VTPKVTRAVAPRLSLCSPTEACESQLTSDRRLSRPPSTLCCRYASRERACSLSSPPSAYPWRRGIQPYSDFLRKFGGLPFSGHKGRYLLFTAEKLRSALRTHLFGGLGTETPLATPLTTPR
jgi:hypothetical protein